MLQNSRENIILQNINEWSTALIFVYLFPLHLFQLHFKTLTFGYKQFFKITNLQIHVSPVYHYNRREINFTAHLTLKLISIVN